MLIGILSDSHGDHLMVRKALSRFDALGVTWLIHCGDVCSTSVFDELVGRACTFVWGNMDDTDPSILAYLETVGLDPPNAIPTRLVLDGKTFAVFHGHERGFHTALDALEVDYILHGHTHIARDDRRGSTRIINPGALYRAETKTIATLETSNDELRFIEII